MTDQKFTNWRKSRHSGEEANCVEVAFAVHGGVGVRDSKHIGPVIKFTPTEWKTFLDEAKEGQYNL